MIVVDASAAVAALLANGPARQLLFSESLHAPHLIDAEVLSTMRRRVARAELDAGDAWAALDVWRRLGIKRHPMVNLLKRAWELRDNVTGYDACYVALAEQLGCALVTADGRLAAAPRVTCSVTVVKH